LSRDLGDMGIIATLQKQFFNRRTAFLRFLATFFLQFFGIDDRLGELNGKNH